MKHEILKDSYIKVLGMDLCVYTDEPRQVIVGVDFYGTLTRAELLDIAKQLTEFAVG